MRIILILTFLSSSVFAYPFKRPRDVEKVIRKYNRTHRRFFRQACRGGDEQNFTKIFRDYRGEGFYIPEYKEKIDINAIKTNLSVVKEKISWLRKVERRLKKESLSNSTLITEPLFKTVDDLLLLKKKYDLSITKREKNKYRKESQNLVRNLKTIFRNFTDRIYFLQSFRFPVDHLKNRMEYVRFKEKGQRRKANKKYFLRKIVEDGALDKDNTYPDKSLRSTIDTLAINIPMLGDFLSEPIRYDLLFVLERTQKELKKGKDKIQERISHWKERTEKAYKYYSKILSNAKKKNSENQKLILKKLKAQKTLQNYVTEKQDLTYKFWANQPELMKAIYTMETILFNEVGRVDGPNALERKDVAKVVLNRFKIPFYQKLDKNQDLYQHFSDKYKKRSDKEKWLNVLFRKGEFSFTYYYIHGNLKIFCPDQTTAGRYLRRGNIKISLDTLWNDYENFKATRYFSRASMNGRIDMSSVWDDFVPLSERAGIKIKHQGHLLKFYRGNLYKYLYEFKDPSGKRFEVVEIKDNVYTLSWKDKKPVFYTYRNPHYFKYFMSKSEAR